MTTPTDWTPTSIDRADAETALYRVAICACTFYPEKPTAEPGYTLAEDVRWCITPLEGVDRPTLERICRLIRDAIIHPTAYRRDLTRELAHLATD
jgi:hypothetical protein